jgi:hypothetical protein
LQATVPASEVREWAAYYEIQRENAVEAKLKSDVERVTKRRRNAE